MANSDETWWIFPPGSLQLSLETNPDNVQKSPQTYPLGRGRGDLFSTHRIALEAIPVEDLDAQNLNHRPKRRQLLDPEATK